MGLLIECRANVTLRTRPHQDTALHLVTYGREISKLKLQPNRTVDVNVQNTGDTTLRLAILRFRTTEAMQSLLDNGTLMEIRGRKGYTSLQYAISLDLEEKAKLPLDNGANPNVQDDHGRTPLQQAVASGKITLGFVKGLVQAGARVDQQDRYERTAMHEAVKCNKKDVIEYLLKSGASCGIEHFGTQGRLQWPQLWRSFSSVLPWPFGK